MHVINSRHEETTMTRQFEDNEAEKDIKNTGILPTNRWRQVAWCAPVLILLLPLVAGAPWTLGDYIFAAILLFGSLAAFETIARRTDNIIHQVGVGLSIAATFLLIWGNAAVSVSDSAADGLYFAVGVLGIVGVIISLFRPRAGAGAMSAAALALVVVSIFTLAAGLVPNPFVSVFELAGIIGFYVVLFGGAAWLLREAAHRRSNQNPI